MKYLEIFNEVVSIMHNDYAGCIDNAGGDNPKEYEEIIRALEEKGELDDFKFEDIVKEYLAYFKDYHVSFSSLKNSSLPTSIGFSVRKYKNKLYVVKTTFEKNLEVGDAIVEVDGIDIPTLAEKYKRNLHEQPDERQRGWIPLLRKHNKISVEKKNGEKIEIKINRYEVQKTIDKYTLNFLDGDIALFKLMDFQNEVAIRNLVEGNKEKLDQCDKWIIDVRNNAGGNDIAYYPLLNYILEEGRGLEQSGENKYLMTERNCKNRIKDLDAYIAEAGDDMPDEIKKIIDVMRLFYEENVGKGFMTIEVGDCEDDFVFEGKAKPSRIVILTDVDCGSSGDQFVLESSKSTKVTTVGRNTLGILDYSNCANEEIDGRFDMMYATSRSSSVDEGKGMKGIGIAPDIYIPWTPEMLERDIDMEKALEILG